MDHSPCPKIRYNVADSRNKINLNTSRLKMKPIPDMELRPKWWAPLVGKATNAIPERSIRDLHANSVPAKMVFYSYFFRPNFEVRQEIMKRVKAFNLGSSGEACAAMHVRRGDVIFHKGAGRYYIALRDYVRGALPFIKALGVTTIFLMTDSQTVIDEAVSCEKDFPDVCQGLKFRYVEKKRWYAAEGGWEVSKTCLRNVLAASEYVY